MKLQETIKSVLKEELTGKHKMFIKSLNDVFDNLNMKNVNPKFGNHFFWYDKNNNSVFEKNNWGMLWILNCSVYNELRVIIIGYFGFPADECDNILINYLNDKYGSEFGTQIIKSVGNETCDPDEFFGNEMGDSDEFFDN